jgi:DNA-binding LacI/PurR family transcriptional regulator
MNKSPGTSNKIADVAKCAGVSQATVSRVFNKHPYVKEDIRNKVITAARTLNYAPKSSRTQNAFGIMVSGDKYLGLGAYETQVSTGVSREFFEHGYNTEITTDQQVSLFHSNTFRALIILTNSVSQQLIDLGIPIILLNNIVKNVHSVVTDHFQGIAMAVEYLISSGHRKIAFISGSPDNWGTMERIKGYKETLAKHNIEFDVNLHEATENAGIIEATVKLMKKKPTAIILSAEGRAQHLSHAMYLLDKKIPEDISVVTFEDSNVSQYLTPPHTTISQNIANLAKTVVDLAIEITTGRENQSVRNIVLQNELIIRESVRRIN